MRCPFAVKKGRDTLSCTGDIFAVLVEKTVTDCLCHMGKPNMYMYTVIIITIVATPKFHSFLWFRLVF